MSENMSTNESTKLTKKEVDKIWWTWFKYALTVFGYERLQAPGFTLSMLPIFQKYYANDNEKMVAALKRHAVFYNTNINVGGVVNGIVASMEVEKANGADISNDLIQNIKVGLMGPLAGIGDPVFWFTVRPILGALGASLALTGNILGPLIFFFAWNAIRMSFLWYTQELGYKAGSEITKDMSGGILQDITKGASILGMFILAVLVERWVSIKFIFNVSSVKLDDKAYIHWDKLPEGYKGIQEAFAQVGSGLSQTPEKVTTFQQNLDSLIPGLMGLLLTFACMWLLKKKVSPITIIIALFVIGVLAHVAGLM